MCLREDALGHDQTPARAMAMRGDWHLREVSLCVRHGHPLLTLWDEAGVMDRYAIDARLGEIAERVLSGEFDAARVTPSPYDLWRDARLESGQDGTWLAGQPLFAATTFCRLLGVELLRLEGHRDSDPAATLRAAQAAGFAISRQGPAAIDAALDRLADLASGAGDGPKKAFGRLYDILSQEYRDEPGLTARPLPQSHERRRLPPDA